MLFPCRRALKKNRETKNTLIATNKFAYMEKIAT